MKHIVSALMLWIWSPCGVHLHMGMVEQSITMSSSAEEKPI